MGGINNVSELELVLGDTFSAVTDGEEAVRLADRSGEMGLRVMLRSTPADALYHSGFRDKALVLFREAEALQAAYHPDHPLLRALQGFRYCQLLVADSEIAALKVSILRANGSSQSTYYQWRSTVAPAMS